MTCMNCGSTHDVIDFYHGNDKLELCVECRSKLATGKLNKAGRPPIGVTKKISLTLPEDVWEWLESKGNRSQFLRSLILSSSESEWSNYACLGYAILGAKKLGYTDKQISELVKAIRSEFDLNSVEDAKKTYVESPY